MPQESQHGDAVMEAVVKTRNGSVLGKGSILKMYFFPGQKTYSNIQIHGAPLVYKVGVSYNFFGETSMKSCFHQYGKFLEESETFSVSSQVDGYPVFSMATPTIAGAKEILAYLRAHPKAGERSQKVVITDLREEAVVYINGTPFVLRELNKPVDTLKHIGITGPAVCVFSIGRLFSSLSFNKEP